MTSQIMVDGVRFVPDVPRAKSEQSIGGFLAKRRQAMGLKQNEACEKLGFGKLRLHRIEAGYEPTLSEAVVLADFYGCSVEDIAMRARK